MKTNQTLSIIGAALLLIGCFLPLINAPIFGSLSYVLNGMGDGIFVALLAVVGLVLAFCNRTVSASITGWLSLGIMGFTLFNLTSRMSAIRTQMTHDLADNPFRGLAEGFTNSITFGVAWPVLFIGAVLLIAAGFMQSTKAIDNRPFSARWASFWALHNQECDQEGGKRDNPTPVKRASFWGWFRDGN